ncbi:MAG: hypothetical protein CL912_08570 [Deltaproteobacteria bacterium]|nr:hypothetical protein [Deltaproteobacteria bacterium]
MVASNLENVQLLTVDGQLIYNFALYVETRSLHTPTQFNDWALSCVYVGRPVGAVIAGLLIRRYMKFKPLLQVNMVVSVGIYFLIAMGCVRKFDNPAPTLNRPFVAS